MIPTRLSSDQASVNSIEKLHIEKNSKKSRNSRDFINNIPVLYKSFNKQYLQTLVFLVKSFSFQFPKELKFIIRKHLIKLNDLKPIHDYLISGKLDNRTMFLLTLIIKHSIKNGSVIDFELLLGILRTIDNKDSKSEIIYAVGYLIKNCKKIDPGILKEITSCITDGVNHEAKIFLIDEIQRITNTNESDSWKKMGYCKTEIPKIFDKKKPQAIVSKNQQAIKIKSKNHLSEETTAKITNLSDLLKNRNKNIETNSNIEKYPVCISEEGDDRFFFRNTYEEVKNLYRIVYNQRLLKKDDKDNYLVRVFCDPSKKPFNNTASCLVIDRMIAAIFLKIISRRRNRQNLTQAAINKLFNLMVDVEKVKDIVLGSPSYAYITNQFHVSWEPTQGPNKIETKLMTKLSEIFKNYDEYHMKFHHILGLHILPQLHELLCYRGGKNDYIVREVTQVLREELVKLKKDAIKVLYHYSMSNECPFCEEQLQKLKDCLGNDENKKIKSFAIKIIRNSNKDDENYYRELFKSCLVQIKNGIDLEESISYINEQTWKEERCRSLFDEKTVRFISELIRELKDDKQKLGLLEVINNCLGYPFTVGLDISQLEHCCEIIKSDLSYDLKSEALRALLMTARKGSLPSEILNFLSTKLNSFDENLSTLILLVLEEISESSELFNLDEVSKKLSDDRVILRDENNVELGERTNENIFKPSISSCAAKTVVNLLKRNLIESPCDITKYFTGKTFHNIVSALDSKDKQTKILSAKSTYFAASVTLLDDFIMEKLIEHFHDTIPDVEIYTKTAFIKGLSKLSKEENPIAESHIELLHGVYAFDETILGEESFTDEINKNILSIIFSEAGKQATFDDKIFEILDHVLTSDESKINDAIAILERLTFKKCILPANTIFALENKLGETIFFDNILKVLENVILNHQKVGVKTLNIFIDNLYLSEDKSLRSKSFRLLDAAGDCDFNDLIDEIFVTIEIERAGNAIGDSEVDVTCKIPIILVYLKEKTYEGHALTINTFEALKDKLSYDEVVSILCNASHNKQIIPDYLMNDLEKKYDPEKSQSDLIELFTSMSKNNQNIPKSLLTKLEKGLDNKFESEKIFSIFALQGQKGERLSKNVKNRICERLLNSCDLLTKQELSSTISSIILNDNDLDQELIKKVLFKCLSDENQIVLNNSIDGFKIFAEKFALDEKMITALLEKACSIDANNDIKYIIFSILENCNLTENQKIKIRLANLKYGSNHEYLEKISNFSEGTVLLEQNFVQIQHIIETEPDLQIKAISILIKCSNKNEIPINLGSSIADLTARTNSKEIKISCFQILLEIAKTAQNIPDDVLLSILAEDNVLNRTQILEFLKLIDKNKTFSIQNSLCMRILEIETSEIDSKKLKTLFEDVSKEIENGIRLPESVLKNLISFYKLADRFLKDHLLMPRFAKIIVLICKQNPKYCSNIDAVSVIEKAIIKKIIDENIIACYEKMIQYSSNQVCWLVMETLAYYLKENRTFKIEILRCFAAASEIAEIPENCVLILEVELESNDENISSLCFRALRALSNNNRLKSEQFEAWCIKILLFLIDSIGCEIELDQNLSLHETIASIRYIGDLTKLSKMSQAVWSRELLLSDMIEKLKISDLEKFTLYEKWVDFEKAEQYKNDRRSDIILRYLHRAQAQNTLKRYQIEDMIKFLLSIEFEVAIKILSENTNQYNDLKQYWIKSMLHQLLKSNQVSDDYVEKLATEISLKFSTEIADKIFKAITIVDNSREFELFINFIEINKVEVSDINEKKSTVSELKRSVEINLLAKNAQAVIGQERIDKVRRILWNLLENKWKFENLTVFFGYFKGSKSSFQEKSFFQILEVIDNYKLNPNHYEAIRGVLSKNPERWIKDLNIIAVDVNFQKIGKIKHTTELLEELKALNKSLKEFANLDLFKSEIEQVKNSYLQSIFEKELKVGNLTNISKWDSALITKWAGIVKNKSNDLFGMSNFKIEALAVIRQANYLVSKLNMTDTQILSCLIFMESHQSQGRILQVGTGEGKSTIVSVLAIIYGLKCKKVDIVTSSPVLAERDAKEKAKLFNMFGLSCSDNNDKTIYVKGPKDCYKKDIVYGEAAQFQFDVLRHEYSLLDTLAGRTCEIVIVDEVDSMLIDDSSKIARLATTVAGFDQMQPIYHYLWYRLKFLLARIINFEGTFYHMDDEITDKIKPDLENLIKSNSDISHLGRVIEEEIYSYIKNCLEEFLSELLKKEQIKISKNFSDFIKRQTPKWINNCISAFQYEQNKHYIVHEGCIKPVDFNSTGIIQSSTSWSDGLHQFLQIKHGLKMTSETLTTNFLSNMGYFKRYGSLFGLTGTLGSEKAKSVLCDVYKVDLVKIPNLQQKQYLRLPTIITENENEWLHEISFSAINEANKGRGVLIVNETIDQSLKIESKIKNNYPEGKIRLYTMNNMNQERHVERIFCGVIIIATNLAGRGTDIKTDDIEEFGECMLF